MCNENIIKIQSRPYCQKDVSTYNLVFREKFVKYEILSTPLSSKSK